VAEVILIFVAVIIAIPLGGFVFSTAGQYTKTADVSVSFVACSAGQVTNVTACTLNMNNSGSASGALRPSSYLLIFYGTSTAAVYSNGCQGQGSDTIKAGSSLIVQCTFAIAPGQSGARFTGWVALVSGQDIPFAGSF